MSAAADQYDACFYKKIDQTALQSARVIAPIVHRLVQPTSVVDVGCGLASWAAVFAEVGAADVWGIDGLTVDPELLRIPRQRFVAADLSAPFSIERSFDLVVALEVAEHLPPSSAKQFIDSLVGLGPVVLFSAAIPGQGGTNHVNERWPDYWAGLFDARGYRVVDCLRRLVWSDDRVSWWYAQNCLLYVSDAAVTRFPSLQEELERTSIAQLRLVHPAKYLDLLATQILERDVAAVIPPAVPFVFVGYGHFVDRLFADRPVIPFLERDGVYWGPPSDDEHAITELARLRGAGARFIVFSRPTFWWLDYYAGFARDLRSRYPCVLDNEVVTVFALDA